MIRSTTILAVAISLLLNCAPVFAADEIHVALNGKDDNNGSAAAPVASLKRARELARKAGQATVIVHEGTWFLPETLVFTAEDSGCTWRAAEGKTVILSGGRRIGGWVQKENGFWSAPVPGAKEWYFRELFVDGKRAVRARFPNPSADPPVLRGCAYKKAGNEQVTLTVDPKHLGNWTSLNDVEIVVNINWASFHKRIQSIDRGTGECTMMPPHATYSGRNAPTSKRYFWFENALEMLDEPGEWYLDRLQETVFYRPREGEDLGKAEVIAPKLEHVILIKGSAEAPVRNLSLHGLIFSHNFYSLPDVGYHGRQASFYYDASSGKGFQDKVNGIPAMVQCQCAQNLSIIGCTVTHGGSNGIELQAGSRGAVIEGNRVHDIAGNGIGIGSKSEENVIPEKNRIANNYVHDCGAVFLGACGIWVGLARETVIAHNLVMDLPYTGISVGWDWSETKTLARDNIIEWNHVHEVMKEVSDGGGIYLLGFQPGSIIRQNHIHRVLRSKYAHISANHGIYFDAGGSGFLVQENLLYEIDKNDFYRVKVAAEKLKFENNITTKGPDQEKTALPEVRAKAGLEDKWKKLQEK